MPPAPNEALQLHDFESSPIPAGFFCPADGRILDLNEAARTLLGFSRAEVAALTTRDLMFPEDLATLATLWERSPGPGLVRARNRRKDGTVFLSEVFSAPTEFAGLAARVVVYVDRSTQQAQALTEQRFREALEATVEGVAILKGDLYQYINPTHAAMYGYTVAELQGQSWRLLYDEKEIRRFETDVFPRLVQEGHWRGPTRGRRKDGSEVTGDISLTLTPSGDLICACRDNSERNRQEEAIRLSQEQLTLVLEATEEGTWDWDVQSGRVVFSSQWLSMLGYSPGELPRDVSSWFDRLHPDDRARVEVEIKSFLNPNGGKLLSEFRMRHKDGSWHWISDRGKVVTRDATGQPIRAVGAHTDITARRVAEFALEQRTQELVAANVHLAQAAQVRDEFLARISHELRTPLTTILALAEMLLGRRAEPLTNRQRSRILSVQESGKHLVELIDEVLDLAKLEAGTLQLNLKAVAVAEIAERAVHLIAPHAQRKELRLAFEPGQKHLAAIADPLRLQQILLNLLSNAVKFTPAGGEVCLSVTPAEGPAKSAWVEFRVTDTGIGIAPAKLEPIFQPFVQLDSGLNRNFGGSGLGLSIVRHFTNLHRGEISVSSQPGQGSEFRVRLPAATVQGGSVEESTSALSASPAAPQPGDFAVLLVDDNRTNRTLVAEFLEDEGFTVHLAAGGPEALACLESTQIDLALVDVQMPGMDGLELTRRIRVHANPRIAATHLVGLTALAMSGDRERCLDAGMDSYLAKPFALAALAALIRAGPASSAAGD
jgi:PAS domain S-box-containing protein